MFYAVETDAGKIRDNNEDYAYAKGNVLIVADGMGGHNAGEVASRMAVDTAVAVLNDDIRNIKEEIENAIDKANEKVYSMATGERNGMGTTMDICVYSEGRMFLGHVGDSRVYIIRDDKAIKITRDHSYVEMLLSKGEITKEEAENYPMKHMITRAVGVEATVECDFYEFEVKKNDKLLMCTDGLTNMVSDEIIAKIITEAENPQVAAMKLVSAANDAGGKDNITVIVADGFTE